MLDEDSERVCSDSMFLIVDVAVVIESRDRGGGVYIEGFGVWLEIEGE